MSQTYDSHIVIHYDKITYVSIFEKMFP